MTRINATLALAAALWAAGAYGWWLEEGRPSFSPDGETIIFHSNQNGGIYTMTAEGRDKTLLVGYDDVDDGSPWNPIYSPDGEKVAFATRLDQYDYRGDIYICDRNGSNLKRLTYLTPDVEPYADYVPIPQKKPLFSPDGTKVLFTHTEDDNSRNWVYTVNVDGTGLTRLSDEDAYDVNPAFSPDGKKIIYASYKSIKPPVPGDHEIKHTDSDIYIMNADGSGKTRLTDGEGDYEYPSFSPDGKLITYVGKRQVDAEGKRVAFVFLLDASKPKAESIRRGPTWFVPQPFFPPGGGKIAYWYIGTPERGFYIEDLASGEKVRIKHVWGECSFSPDGEKIVFVGGDGVAQIIEIINADGTGLIETYQYYDEK